MNNVILDELVKNKTIKCYSLTELDENGDPGRGKFRNTEQLVIVFHNNEKITIDTFCSGCNEDTSLIVS